MRSSFVIILILCSSLAARTQERAVFRIPDLPGYRTLVCDFNLHTVFSDGKVSPMIRIDEAWNEGLDAIAITDKLEYLPHKENIDTNNNRSSQIAADYAANKNVLLIPATEITKTMPPGHLNAIFIKDAESILNEDYKKSIEEAAGQGAFIFWNYPGLKVQQADTTKWWDENSFLYDHGWLQGIEVANNNEFYPEALDWAISKNLTILGNSDKHGPFQSSEFTAANHRTCTLVFATEKSTGGIREALFNGRTIAYTGEKMIGNNSLLKALFLESVKLEQIDASQSSYALLNSTDLYFDIRISDKIFKDWEKEISLKPHYESFFMLSQSEEEKTPDIQIQVMNFISGANEVLTLPFDELDIVHQ